MIKGAHSLRPNKERVTVVQYVHQRYSWMMKGAPKLCNVKPAPISDVTRGTVRIEPPMSYVSTLCNMFPRPAAPISDVTPRLAAATSYRTPSV